MKKNLIALAVAGALVAPAAMADISFSGDARMRYGHTDQNDVTANNYDNRVRLKIVGKTEGGATANARISYDRNKDAVDANDITKTISVAEVDYAYITAPLGPVTLTAGDVKVKWGAGLTVNNTRIEDRVALTYKADAFSASLLVDELGGGSNGGAVKAKVAGWDLGVITKQGNTANTWTDAYAMGEVAGLKIAFEHSTYENDATGTVAHLIYPMGGMNLHGAFVSTADGFATNNFFAPVSVVGSDQLTAENNLGGAGDSTTFLVGVDMAAGPGHFTAMAGQYDWDGLDEAKTVYDLQYKYPLGKGASLNATYGSIADVNDAFGATVNVKF